MMCFLVAQFQPYGMGLSAELGSLIANVSPMAEVTSSVL